MPLTDAPIPPRPEFSPFGAPPGVAVDFSAFKAFNSAGQTISAPWWQTRLVIKSRLALVHTNGASKEGNITSQVNWANSSPNNTHPHYCVNAPQPTKFVPSDRKGIGNYRVSDYSIVIETADAGWPAPGNAGGFLYDHAELVARILAYESIVADLLGSSMPLEYPDRWDGTGVGCHTEPFGYPYWTNVEGKACPGTTKKAQVRDEILPRARQIRAAWLQPPEDDVKFFCIDRVGTPTDPVPVWATSDGITAVRVPSYLAHRVVGLEVVSAEQAKAQYAFVNALEFVPRP